MMGTKLDACGPLLSLVNLSPRRSGTCSVRAGYGTMNQPYLDTDSVVSRYRDRKTNRTIMLAGSDCYVDAASRANARPMHEERVVSNYDSMVC